MSSFTYKQVGYHYCGPLELIERSYDASKLGADDILVKVSAAALNPVDLILYNSSRFFKFFTRTDAGIGRDFSGVIEAVGSSITKFQKGDKVSGLFEDTYTQQGTLSQYLIINTKKNHNIGTIPKNLTMEEAAAFPLTFGTAYTTLVHFKKPSECQNILVIGGATSVGAFVIQLLKKVHKVPFVVSVNSSSSSEKVLKYGADVMVDYTKGSVKSQVLELVKQNGKFDIIVDCVGSSEFISCMDDVLKPKSEGSGYTSINGTTVGDYHSPMTQYLSWANIKLLLFPRSFAFVWSYIEDGTWYEYAKGLFEEGVLEVPVDSVHKLENFKEAIATIIDHKAQGKVVVSME